MSEYYPSPDELRDAWINESTSFPDAVAETVEARVTETYSVKLAGRPARCWKWIKQYRPLWNVKSIEVDPENEAGSIATIWSERYKIERAATTYALSCATSFHSESETGIRGSKLPTTAGGDRISPARTLSNSVAVNVVPSSAIPEDAEESLADWYRERDRIQNEHDLEEQTWREQELLQDETDNT